MLQPLHNYGHAFLTFDIRLWITLGLAGRLALLLGLHTVQDGWCLPEDGQDQRLRPESAADERADPRPGNAGRFENTAR